MAIYLYYGKIGDGKTYHVLVNEVLPAVRKGRKIYTNLDGLNVRRLSQFVGREVEVVQWNSTEEIRAAFQLAQDDKEGLSLQVERGSLLIVDEAQMIFDARQWKDTGPGTLRLCEYHRHFGLDIVFITQSPGRLDKSLCRLANESLHVKNLRFLGSLFGKRYVINVRQTPWDRETMATMTGAFKSEYFALYRSAVVNARARVSKSAMKLTWFIGPVGIAAALIFFTRNGGFGFTKVARMNSVVLGPVASAGPVAGLGPISISSLNPVTVAGSAVSVALEEGEEEPVDKVGARMLGKREIGGEVVYYLQLENSRKSIVQVSDLAGYDVEGAL